MMCAIEFIPSGSLRRDPLRHEMSPEELEMLKENGAAEQAELELGEGQGAAEEDDDEDEFEDVDEDNELVDDGKRDTFGLPASLRMDEYDEEEDAPGLMSKSMIGFEEEEEDDEGSDAEDNVIESSDIVLMSARTDEEISILEVHCYDAKTGNLWIHHDITLAAFPLCISFLDMPPSSTVDGGASGAYVAVGTFKPGIEIWNLDVLDPLEPSAVLGGPDPTFEKRKGKKGRKKHREPPLLPDSHTDAVMTLDWNRNHRQILASGGADTVVKLWDVTTQQCSHTCTHHSDKVQSVAWHPTEGSVLATGSYDRNVCVLDARSPSSVSTMVMPSDLECVKWDPHRPERVVACCEDGTVACFDPRNPSTALWTMNAHPAGVSSLSFAPHVNGLFATASQDKSVKLWDCAGATPVCVGQRDIGVGKLFGVGWCGDEHNPFTLGCAGSKGIVGLWEVDESEAVGKQFGARLSTAAQTSQTNNETQEVVNAVAANEEDDEDLMGSSIPVSEVVDTTTKKSKKKKKKDNNKKKTITK